MKRFTNTEKWKDSWFRKLSPTAKLLWNYLCDSCDNCGVAAIDFEAFSFFLGTSVEQSHLQELGDRVVMISEEKLWIRKFVDFQFGKLSRSSRVHISIYGLLMQHGLSSNFELSDGSDTPRKRITDYFRKEIYKTDQYRCQWCGNAFTHDLLTVDHVVPVIDGGTNTEDNVVTCCISCNAKKRDSHPLIFAEGKQVLDRLSKILDRLYKELHSPKDKDKDKDKDSTKGGVGGVGVVLVNGSSVSEKLTQLLREAYNRNPEDRFDYFEEFTIGEISKRPRCLDEAKEILAYRSSMKEQKYFPKSVRGLIEAWNKTLDRARQENSHSLPVPGGSQESLSMAQINARKQREIEELQRMPVAPRKQAP